MIKVMFVCLGNICRSPMAEAVFQKIVNDKGLQKQFHIESSGTGAYHIGEDADPRTLEIVEKYQLPLSHAAQQVKERHLLEFDYLLAMDQDNLLYLLDIEKKIVGSSNQIKAKIFKMTHFSENFKDQNVPDPYFGLKDGFEEVYQMVLESSHHLLDHIMKNRQD